jgi:uncharacterized damage-inducible protein DinB
MDFKAWKILAEYNRKANSDMNAIIQNLSADQWNQEFKGYFNSIKSLCNHIYLADFTWLKRFSKLRKFAYINNALFDQELRFGSIVFETIEAYLDKRKALDAQLIEFVNEITQEDLGKDLEYADSQGKDCRRLFGGLVLHCFNHQTHHRGMISIYLENMGISNDYSNLANMEFIK